MKKIWRDAFVVVLGTCSYGLVLVALQAMTLARPMLAPVGENATPAGKCFFVQHFFDALRTPAAANAEKGVGTEKTVVER